MLSLDENNRISHQELWDWVKPYEKHILSRENFIFESAPAKVDQEFQLIRKLLSSILIQGAPIQSSLPNVLSNSPPVAGQYREVRSSFSGQKINFPPPQVRTSYLNEASSPSKNGNINQAESVYVPAVSGRVSDREIKENVENKVEEQVKEGSSPERWRCWFYAN